MNSIKSINQNIKLGTGSTIDAGSIFKAGKVVALNDGDNMGRVRIQPIANFLTPQKELETGEFAESLTDAYVLYNSIGENHGNIELPEIGDYVFYFTLSGKNYILGSFYNHIKVAPKLRPHEVRNSEKVGDEYLVHHYPSAKDKKMELDDPVVGDKFRPMSKLNRWRGNDMPLSVATHKLNDKDFTTQKFTEFRTNENQLIQMVDIGNADFEPGTSGKLAASKSYVRQTDKRDLWHGFTINKEYWKERTEYPPKPHESQYIKLSTNNNDISEEAGDWPDVGSPKADLIRGTDRLDDRMISGSFESGKIIAPNYQEIKTEAGSDERYLQDRAPAGKYAAAADLRKKIEQWIDSSSGKKDHPKTTRFAIGHQLTLSNTLFKRRIHFQTKKEHSLLMSDIDKDEKIILNSHKGKYIYMEDSAPESYDVLWIASQKHHMIFCDHQADPFLINNQGELRDKLVDPNQKDGSTYQLIQTANKQKIWLADSEKCPRIHLHTKTGHEILLLDHDNGEANISPDKEKGKIQITTNDKQMQILLDVMNGDIVIINKNMSGKGNTGNIKIYAENDIIFEAKNQIKMKADMGFKIESINGNINMDACNINQNCASASAVAPDGIRPTVLTDIETPTGQLKNKFDGRK